ncbi:class E sortase [Candidatus Microgenomates bacterium]|nr:class E sortase [Candidatus Microgenomates bacterium]
MADGYYQKKGLIPHWLKRELAVFGGMFVESSKFILVSFLVFGTIFGSINGPAIWNNVRWWWYVNYVDDHSGSWWGLKLPSIGDDATPDNTLFIPKIGVQTPIQYSKTRLNSEVNKLLLDGVVHYADTALPGKRGNVFITGHSSFYWWSKGNYNSIFSILDKLVVGDIVYINYNGVRYTYRVEKTKVTLPTDLSVLSQGDENILTLMTCTPVGTNYRRLIVTAKQISPAPPSAKKTFLKL